MRAELRALGLAHGLLLGLLLASPLLDAALLPRTMVALFLLSGFQLRLADRRLTLRSGIAGWFSHLRMVPMRVLPWGAAALVALVAGQDAIALATLGAALSCELLLYPVGVALLPRLPRPAIALALVILIAFHGAIDDTIVRYCAAFLAGNAACLVWLRGPDGDARALLLSAAGGMVAALSPRMIPALAPFAPLAGMTCATIALAHLSVLRRRPVPWRTGGAARTRGLRPAGSPIRARPS